MSAKASSAARNIRHTLSDFESLPKKGRGGKRTGAGRRKNLPENEQGLPSGAAPNKSQASAIIASLDIPDVEWEKLHPAWSKDPYKPCICWKCLWRHYARSERGGAEYLWNRAEGRPVQTVNHLHDKPIEMNVNVKLS